MILLSSLSSLMKGNLKAEVVGHGPKWGKENLVDKQRMVGGGIQAHKFKLEEQQAKIIVLASNF
jgi:hypothetical protein